MKLVRFVSPPSEWRQALQKRDRDKAPMPALLLESFAPSRSERDHISMYRLDDGIEALRLAAAYHLKIKGEFALLCLNEATVTGAGFALKVTPGQTDYKDVNERHVDVVLPTAQDVLTLADMFYTQGELRSVAAHDLRLQVANDNEDGVLDLAGVAKSAQGPVPVRLCDIIGHKAVTLVPTGKPQPI